MRVGCWVKMCPYQRVTSVRRQTVCLLKKVVSCSRAGHLCDVHTALSLYSLISNYNYVVICVFFLLFLPPPDTY